MCERTHAKRYIVIGAGLDALGAHATIGAVIQVCGTQTPGTGPALGTPQQARVDFAGVTDPGVDDPQPQFARLAVQADESRDRAQVAAERAELPNRSHQCRQDDQAQNRKARESGIRDEGGGKRSEPEEYEIPRPIVGEPLRPGPVQPKELVKEPLRAPVRTPVIVPREQNLRSREAGRPGTTLDHQSASK